MEDYFFSLFYYDEWAMLALHWLIQDLRQRVTCPYHILDLKNSLKVWDLERGGPKGVTQI
jgi:hypothetical protein